MNMKQLKDLDRNEILSMLGLETKTSTAAWIAGTMGTFGVGLLVGAGLGLLLAPTPGRTLRCNIRDHLHHVHSDLDEVAQGFTGNDTHLAGGNTKQKTT